MMTMLLSTYRFVKERTRSSYKDQQASRIPHTDILHQLDLNISLALCKQRQTSKSSTKPICNPTTNVVDPLEMSSRGPESKPSKREDRIESMDRNLSRLKSSFTVHIPPYRAEIRRVIAEDLAIVRRQLEQKKREKSKTPRLDHTSSLAPARGKLPYCTYRKSKKYRPYRANSTGQHCRCKKNHAMIYPEQWKSTPCEAEWDYDLPNGGYHHPRAKKVRFAEPVVSELRVFERWYKKEYILSDKYWAKGPVRCSEDESTELGDEIEGEWVEAMEKLRVFKRSRAYLDR